MYIHTHTQYTHINTINFYKRFLEVKLFFILSSYPSLKSLVLSPFPVFFIFFSFLPLFTLHFLFYFFKSLCSFIFYILLEQKIDTSLVLFWGLGKYVVEPPYLHCFYVRGFRYFRSTCLYFTNSLVFETQASIM